MTAIRYLPNKEAWTGFDPFLGELIEGRLVGHICEVGGGANPALGLDYLTASGIEYAVLDISEGELAKAPAGYRKILADICDPQLSLPEEQGRYDLVFSKMLAEHVPDGEVFHRNVRSLLRPGGIAFHFFSTLYAFPFLVNKLTPDGVSSLLLRLFARRDDYRRAKFPAYYSLCYGPTRSQLRRLAGLGYEVLEYRGFFGNEGYYRRLPPLRWAHRRAVRLLLAHPVPQLTSFAYVVLRKP